MFRKSGLAHSFVHITGKYGRRNGLKNRRKIPENGGKIVAKEIERRALELSDGTAEKLGVYVVDVSYEKNKDGDNSLCFYIDREGGVGIDECESFSKSIETILDEENIIDENYVLEVSSPGVDRTLKKEREFLYYVGREVDIKLFGALDGAKEFTGTLTGFADGVAKIEYNGKVNDIPVKQAVYIKLSFKF